MVRRAATALLVVGTVVAGVGSTGVARADSGLPVTIMLAQAFPGGPPVGWSSSGAFSDSGSWTSDFVNGSFPSPTTAAFHRTTTEVGAGGTFHMTIDFTITVVGPASATWVIPRTGTDGYAALTGQGTCEPTSGPTPFVITCTGTVHT
jgi:hypothetical protein